VTKQSRVYLGISGQEISSDVPQEVHGTFLVISGKAGWKGAAKLVQKEAAEEEEEGEEEAVEEEGNSSDAHSLLEAAREARSAGVVLCWKETQTNGYLSNWASSPIVIDGLSYNCVEQWIMASKARACGDEAILSQILQSKSPRKQKGLGRSIDDKLVRRFWTLQRKWEAQVTGVGAKFKQNEHLAIKLLRTGSKRIGEASPSDRVFGIGLAPSDPAAQDPQNWRGLNLLGKALMCIRDELRCQVLVANGETGFVPETRLQEAFWQEAHEEEWQEEGDGDENSEDALC